MAYELTLYGEIGATVNARAVRESLKAAGRKPAAVRLHSAGGSVFEGLAIYHALRAHAPGVSIYVDGVAASMASVVAMAGREIILAENAWMMIHDPVASIEGGSADDMRQMAALLDQTRQQLAGIYAARTGQTPEAIGQLMAAETWLTGDQAVAAGFATRVGPALSVAAKLDLSGFHPPSALLEAKPMSASIAELKAALPGAPADFILAQLEAGADVNTARAAWLDSREKALTEREQKLSAPKGVSPLGAHQPRRSREASTEGNFAQMVNELVAKGTPRGQAVAAVGRLHPELHREFVAGHNSTSARIQSLIEERFAL